MHTRHAIAAGIAVIGLAVGANQMLEPRTPAEIRNEQQTRQIENLSDSQERSDDNKRENGNDHLNAEIKERNQPVEPRPGLKPKLRFRIP